MSKHPTHPSLEQIELSSIFEAVSDPIRRKILVRLAEVEEAMCSAFLEYAPKTNLSYHIAKLRDAGLTYTRIEGTKKNLSLRRADMEKRFPGLLEAILESCKLEERRSKRLSLPSRN
ncbi:transcriptional regulator [Leptospira langatensis]|uniref:Transcriptional regulator n=1 Tax=Leptospira langatensis TaxID=2484983 RepID=A0A5F1ZQE4_9LEPT|nr:helix-turn-helix domain-containing protein [Leptospira langatensis]TGK05114.1 transcriptional regulator [Leptospira langatensis]TGL38250.1 transcriptional regulator [Leptospira langatensis]